MSDSFASCDDDFLRRAIRLAMNGRGRVEPNPMVGCVIVKNDRIIGEGFHAQFGGPHAEPAALVSCVESPQGATAYVTLEPCCHTNKKTPPCAPRLIDAKLARVVIGCVDPNPDVNGKGIAMLRTAGIQVECAEGELQAEAQQLIAPFIATTRLKRPYITLKWAQTANGKVAGENGARLRITNHQSNKLIHQLRAQSDAIMVGINTVLADDPLLTARGVEHARPLIRYVLDRNLRIPLTSKLVQTARDSKVVVVANTKRADLSHLGVETICAHTLTSCVNDMLMRGIQHLLIEPGPTLAASLFDENLADRVWIFRSPNSTGAGGLDAPRLPQHFVKTAELNLNGDLLTEYMNSKSDVTFAHVPSSDMILATETSAEPTFIISGT